MHLFIVETFFYDAFIVTFLKWFWYKSAQMMVRVVLSSEKANLCRLLTVFIFLFPPSVIKFESCFNRLLIISYIINYSSCLPIMKCTAPYYII